MLTGPGVEFDVLDFAEEHVPQEVAVLVRDGGDGTFDPSDSLLFYARSLDRFVLSEGGAVDSVLPHVMHTYADANVYWLTWGGQAGSRIEPADAAPDGSPSYGVLSTEHIWLEEDLAFSYWRGWTWYRLYPGIPLFFYPETPGVAGPARIEVGFGKDQHDAPVTITMDGDTLWSGLVSASMTVTLDSLDLPPMPMLAIRPGSGSYTVYLEHISISYPRTLSDCGGRLLFTGADQPGRRTLELGMEAPPKAVLDVSDPLAPQLLEGAEWSSGSLTLSHGMDSSSVLIACRDGDLLSPDSLYSAGPGRLVGAAEPTDVAIIAGRGLEEASQPLLAVYEARGRTCQIVGLQEVADEFGAGIVHPGAVRSFIRFMLDDWSQPVEEVVLVGDGHYDFLNRITSVPSPFPLFYTHAFYDLLLCKDDYFTVCHQDQEVPEVAISRIPVDDAGELAAYLAKLSARDLSDSGGPWAVRDLLIADDEWGDGASEYMHTEDCEALADSIPSAYRREKFYMIEYPWPPGTDPGQGVHPNKPEAREDLVALMSQGWRTAWFFGHGSHGQLAKEKLLLASDAVRVTSGAASPVFLMFCCNAGDFFRTASDCLAEAFAATSQGGAIVSISPVGGTASSSNWYRASQIQSIIEDQPDLGISQVLWQAKVALSADPGRYGDPAGLSSTSRYHCLGDGGVVVARPSPLAGGLSLAGDSLFRGRSATLDVGAGDAGSAHVRVTESGSWVDYTMLGGGVITYRRNGEAIYGGSMGGGSTELELFVPLQADTGSYARVGALAVGGSDALTAEGLEWLELADAGGYVQDSTPPQMELWLEGCRGEASPRVWGDVVVRAHLQDASGICVLGGAAGRTILLSVDGQGFDVGKFFTYRQGSASSGDLEYTLPALSEGDHRLILAAWDGMANGVQDTLDFQVVQSPGRLLDEVLVYPNPGDGLRVFSFQASEAGQAEVVVYTAAGRAIWHGSTDCRKGYNQLVWNGRDDDGDAPASGTYVYRLTVSAEGHGSSEKVGRLVVIR
jgi:hypothetical protein